MVICKTSSNGSVIRGWFCRIRLASLSCLVVLMAGMSGLSPAKEAGSLQELREILAGELGQPRFSAATWGIKVVSLDTQVTLFETNSEKLFSPASNTKLFTVALALDQLGADYQIRTSLYLHDKPGRQGTVQGDLIVYGRGDPSIRFGLSGGDYVTGLGRFVAVVTNAGVRAIRGDVVGDESYFLGPRFGSGWSWSDLEHPYGAAISALTINDNVLELSITPGESVGRPGHMEVRPLTMGLVVSNGVRTVANGCARSLWSYQPPNGNTLYLRGDMPMGDSGEIQFVPAGNPAQYFALLLQSALRKAGITIRGQARSMDWLEREAHPLVQEGLVDIGTIQSPPLAELVKRILKESQNLHADLLLAHAGEKTRVGFDQRTSEQLGILALEKFLVKAGIPGNQVLFEEGSGLSRNNLSTPAAIVALLQYMTKHPAGAAFVQALPIAGRDGTLRDRMRGTAAEGNVRAKTGTLRWAHGLSGLVTTAGGEHLAFALLINRFNAGTHDEEARVELDKIAALLAEFSGRSEPSLEGRAP